MTLGNANELHAVQALMGSSYYRNGAEVQREHEYAAVDGLINTLVLEKILSFQPGTEF